MTKKNEKKHPVSTCQIVIGFAVYITVFILDVFFMTDFGFGNIYYTILGCLLLGFGGIFSMIGRINLGQSYHFLPQAKTLVTTGLYKWFRNPIYIGNQISLTGFAIVLGSTVGLIATIVILVPVHIIRAKYEERILIDVFGKKYLNYREKTLF